MTLFRTEVNEHRANRLHGDVGIAIPMSWQVIGYTLLSALILAALFLTFASYDRTETVPGVIVLDRGVAQIMPTRPGIVAALEAQEGQVVRAGSPLLRISAEESLGRGDTGTGRVLDALEQQDQDFARQAAETTSAAAAEQGRLNAQIGGLRLELASLDQQIRVQRELVASAMNEVETVRGVAARGFISRRDVLARQEALLARQQQLAQLQQLRVAKAASLTDTQRSVLQMRAQAAAQVAGLSSNRAELAQRRVGAQLGRGYVLVSPIDGTATAITGRVGQVVTSQQAVMTIVPAHARPQAELYVPTSAAGFLAIGQTVRLAVDAFPYQRFGTVEARISRISGVAIARPGPDGSSLSVYLVTVEISHPWIPVVGRHQPLLPGMTLTARIVTARQSLFEWLFEPVLAVRRR